MHDIDPERGHLGLDVSLLKKKEIQFSNKFQLLESQYALNEILDIDKISSLLEKFYFATGLANSILDLEGNILFGIGWKSICTDFHRINKKSAERCHMSDTVLANKLEQGEKHIIYTCGNGLVDVATPIVIENQHLANLFIGQFFFNKPDRNYFIKQATEFGFDKEKYLKALEDCNVYSKESILSHLDFLSELLNVLGENALEKIKSEKLLAEVNISKRYNRGLIEASPDPLVTIAPNGTLTDVNTATEKATGFAREKLIGTLFLNYFTDPTKAKEGYQKVFKEGRVIDYDLELRHASGSTIPVLYNAAVYKDEQEKVIGVFAAARDISSIRKVENELFYIKNNLELLVEQRTRELENAQLLLKSSLESPKDMIILSIDKNYNYYFFNQAHHDAMAYAYGKDVNLSMNLLEAMSSKEDIQKAKTNYDLALNGKSHTTIEKYGEEAIGYYETFYNPIINDKNEVVGATAFARNVTDRIVQEEKINELNNQLENRVLERTAQLEFANKELESFAYSVSHDLRAPLRALAGFSEVLLTEYGNTLDSQGNHYLERIQAASLRMGDLIDDLLKLSRVARTELTYQRVDLGLISKEIVSRLQGSEPSHQLEIVIRGPLQLNGDLSLMQLVMENLLNNAWKFTSKATKPYIEVGKIKKNGQNVYYVKDNGAGFNMAYANKLFAPFQRLHTTSEFPGNGIGLATVKRIIALHGGGVWAEGEVGRGATIYFTVKEEENDER